MSYPIHHVPAGDVLPIFFSSYGKTNGESITLTGLAVTDIEIYRDGSVTQRASDAGYTLLDTDGIDFDGITGIHGFSIDTGDNTDAGFYAVGAWYHVVVSAVTVDGQTVNFVAAAFRIMAAEGVAGVPDVNTTHISDTAQTGNDVGGDVNEILLDTAEIGTAGAGLTNINLPDQTMNITGDITGNLSGSVGSVTGAVGSVTGNVGGNVTGSVGSLAAQAKADVNAEVDTAIADARLDELLSADSDIDGAAPPTVGSVFHELLTKTAGSFTYDQTTDSLEAIRDKETDIETDTAEIGAAGAGLTNINLPNQTMDIVGNITGNLSGSVGSVTGAVGSVAAGGITAASIATGAIDADALAADAVDEILDELIGDSTVTMRQALKLMVAALGGKLSGAATTTVTIRNAADDTDRITATVDADGNRSAVTLSL